VLTSDKSQLAGLQSVTNNPADWVILADTLSKEPLGPMYIDNDSLWGDLVNWSVYATFQAEEIGITSENVESMMGGGDITTQRFLGETEDNYGQFLGVDNAWAANIIKETGNYAEIYERNVVPINIPREGSLNAAWKDGGLLYAPAWR
jgi:general L-amino acid transport system substrate-binding protein